MIDLGTLGGGLSQAFGINGSGQIVGYSTTVSDSGHAFLYENGVMTDLTDLIVNISGWDLISAAYDINDLGQIVGYGMIGQEKHAFLLSPSSVPVPPAVVLLGSSLAAFQMIRHRRRSKTSSPL